MKKTIFLSLPSLKVVCLVMALWAHGKKTHAQLVLNPEVFKTGIWVTGGDVSIFPNVPLQVNSPGIEGGRFVVKPEGKVGIGNPNPSSKLSFGPVLEPKVALFPGGANKNYGFGVSNLQLNYHVGKTGSHVFYAGGDNGNGTELLRVSDDGNIGIGGLASLIPYDDNNTLYGKEALAFVAANPETQIRIEKGVFSLHPEVPFEIDEPGFPGGRFKVDTNGNVGIGTASPYADLHIRGKGGDSRIVLGSSPGEDYRRALLMDRVQIQIAANSSLATPMASIGTVSDTGLELTTGDLPRLTINDDGDVGIGVEPGTGENRKGRLHIKGSLHVENDDHQVFHVSGNEEVVFVGTTAYDKWKDVRNSPDNLYTKFSLWVSAGIVSENYALADVDHWADDVFNEDYELPSLEEVADFVGANKHLPYVPSEADVKQNGYNLHELNLSLLRTIEELTLHTIEQEGRIKEHQKKLDELSELVSELKHQMEYYRNAIAESNKKTQN